MIEEASIFFREFEDIVDNTVKPKLTELVRPSDASFDPSNISGFSSVVGSHFEAGHTFRNVFNSNVSPSDIQAMIKNGLVDEARNLLKSNGIGGPLLQSITSKKTRYTYPESERKLRAKNLTTSTNPLGFFSSVLNRVKTAAENDDPNVTTFYSNLNFHRKKLFMTNTNLFDVLEEIIQMHARNTQIDRAIPVRNVFNTEVVYSDGLTVKQQVKNVVDVISAFESVASTKHVKYIKESEEYVKLLAELRVIRDDLVKLGRVTEFKYVREDLKDLRKTESTPEYREL